MLKLSTGMMAAEIEDSDVLSVVATTADSWSEIQDISSGDDVTLVSVEGSEFAGSVSGYHEALWTVTIELR